MLKVNYDTYQGDYLDYIVPFTKAVIANGGKDYIPQDVSDLVLEEFGLHIPVFVSERVLKRLTKQGTLKRENHRFSLNKDISTDGFEDRRSESKRDYQRVCVAMQEHLVREFKVEITIDEAASGILSCIERFSLDYLRSHQQGTALPVVENRLSDGSLEFYASHFIASISKSASPTFESLVNLVKGKMLSNALLCEDLTSIDAKFDKVTFYVDSPLLLRLLNLDSESNNRTSIELLKALKQLGARVAIFRHCVIEAEGILRYAAENFHDPTISSGIVPELRTRGVTASDIQLIAIGLDAEIETLDINVENAPHYDLNYQIDEAGLRDVLREGLNYRREAAIDVDVNSVRSVYALRMGNEPTCIEKAIAVFVTHNHGFSGIAFDFGKRASASMKVPAVVTDYGLLNIAWLKSPIESSGLPAVQLISNCAAAMEPTIPLWNSYLKEVDRLAERGNISSDDHQLLRYAATAREELMNLTAGSDLQLSDDTVIEILERTKSDLTREKDKEITSLRESLDEQKAAKENVELALSKSAMTQSLIITRSIFALLFLLIVCVIIVPSLFSDQQSFLIWILIIIGMALCIANLVTGWSALSVVEKIRTPIYRWRLRTLLKAAGIGSKSDSS